MEPKVVKPAIVRRNEGTFLIEGDELTRVLFQTGKIIFAESTLLPGQKSSLDEGHKEAHEICYVINGQVAVNFPGLNRCELLQAGEAMLIPEGEPHYIINCGETKACAIWACAPHL